MEKILIDTLYLFGIIILIALMYSTIWMALFYPITKLRKHNKAVAEAHKELNELEVKTNNLMLLEQEQREKYDQLVLKYFNLSERVKEKITELEANAIPYDETEKETVEPIGDNKLKTNTKQKNKANKSV